MAEHENKIIINCKFCGTKIDKTTIKRNGDYGFCPNCHKVLLLKTLEEAETASPIKKFSIMRKEFNPIYELALFIILSYAFYTSIQKYPHSIEASVLFHVPYMAVTCVFLPYTLAKFIAAIYFFHKLIQEDKSKVDYYVIAVYLICSVFALYFIAVYAFASYSLYFIRDLAFPVVLIVMLIFKIRDINR